MREELLKRYNRFKRAVNHLDSLTRMNPEEVINDYTLLSSLERNIQVAVEFIIDFSNYILSETIGEVPDTYKEVVVKTGNVCGIEENLVKEIRGAIGLRNILVHLYADIDYDIILRELKRLINNILKYTSELFKCIDKLSLDP